MNQFIQNNQQVLEQFARENKLKYLALFGSYARGDQKSDSDIDLLVEYSPGTSLLDVVGMEQQLKDKIGKKVDLVSKKYLNKYLKPYILKDLIQIYEQK